MTIPPCPLSPVGRTGCSRCPPEGWPDLQGAGLVAEASGAGGARLGALHGARAAAGGDPGGAGVLAAPSADRHALGGAGGRAGGTRASRLRRRGGGPGGTLRLQCSAQMGDADPAALAVTAGRPERR